MNTNIQDFTKLKIVLKVSGHWLEFETNSKIKIIFQKIRLLYLIILTPLSIISMILSGKESLSKNAFWTTVGIFISFMSLTGLTQWNLLKSITNQFFIILKTRNINYQIIMFKNQFDFIWPVFKLYIINCFIFTILYEILPYFYDIYLAFMTNSTKPFMTPLPNEGFLIENQTRNFFYYTTNIITTLWALNLTCIGVGFEIASIIYIAYACIELKIINGKILEWGRNNGQHGSKLKEIIIEHQRILKLTTDMKEFFGGPLAAQNTMGSVSLTLYTFTIMVKLKTDIILVLVNVFCLIVMFLILLASCFMGEKLQTEGQSIFESLCQIPWYEMSPKIRKDLNMMIRQAKRPMVISYKGRSPLTLATLMQILNSSYSYFMVLKSMN